MEDILTKGSLTESVNHGGDCRTAPATPGLLNITAVVFSSFFPELICAVDFVASRQFMASAFGIPFMERINCYPLTVLACSNQARIHSNT